MLRLLTVALLPLLVLSQCSSCNQQADYLGIYGNSYGSSPQYSSGQQYVCNSCQMNGGQQFSCNNCKYSPSSSQVFRDSVTTTPSSSYTLGQCTCNNCQIQGSQYSCNACQYANQQFQSTSNQYNGFSSPNANQQFYNPSSVSPTLHYNDLTNTNVGYPLGYSSSQEANTASLSFGSPINSPGLQPLFDGSAQYNLQQYSTASPSAYNNLQYSNSQFGYSSQYNPSQYGNSQFGTTMSPYGSPQYSNTQFGYSSSSYTSQYNPSQYSNSQSGITMSRQYNNPQYNNGFSTTASPYDNAANQPNDGTYVSGQYLPGVQGHLYDSRVGLTQFNTEVRRR